MPSSRFEDLFQEALKEVVLGNLVSYYTFPESDSEVFQVVEVDIRDEAVGVAESMIDELIDTVDVHEILTAVREYVWADFERWYDAVAMNFEEREFIREHGFLHGDSDRLLPLVKSSLKDMFEDETYPLDALTEVLDELKEIVKKEEEVIRDILPF